MKFDIDNSRLPLVERIAYSPDEAARLIGFSRNGLYQHLNTGDLRSSKIGPKKRLILRSDLISFVQKLANAPALPTPSATADEDRGVE